MPIVFAAIAPHPPIILPDIGSPEDRLQVKNTIESLEDLGKKLKAVKPDSIIISSPHPEWGIKVPLHFLNFKNAKLQFKIQNYLKVDNIAINRIENQTIYPILTVFDSPKQHYEWGKKFYQSKVKNSGLKIALIASGDLSHCLREDGPYGFHPHGPEFDKELIESLEKKDITNILKLNDKYLEAGECGLRSFCFILGMLEEAEINYQPEILSYQAPFGVGYLTANFKLL